jgi:SAM-dependent methyltransferase
MSLSQAYDRWHAHVHTSDPEHRDERSPWYDLVLEHIGPVEGKRVLEIACGRGGFVKFLVSQGAKVIGADFSQVALQIAAAKLTNGNSVARGVPLTCADAQLLPFAANSFDIVISCETIEHLPDPGSALKEMGRVCRTGGLLYLTTPNYFNAMGLYYVYARLRGRPATPGSDQPTDHVFFFPEIRGLLKRAGWTIIRSDGTVHQFPMRPGHNPVAMPSLESNRGVRRILSPLAFHYFLLAKKNKAS